MAVAALAIGVGSVGAGNPPITGFLRVDPPTVGPGATFSATFFGCDENETVNFDVAGTTVSAPCNLVGCLTPCRPGDVGEPAAGSTLTAPAAPGTYNVMAAGLTSGATASATLSVVAGGMPATGSDGAPIAQVAAGLVAVGTGIVVVAGVRRRKAAA
jgi:hypothetical protein